MRAVCLALFLATITFSAGCIPVGNSGLGKKAEAKKVAVEEPQKENVDVPEKEPPARVEKEKPAVEVPAMKEMEKLSKEDAEKAARTYFDGEMAKWMTGKFTMARPIRYIANQPLKYEILSVIFDPGVGLPADIPPGDRVAFRFNISVTFESGTGTPVQKVIPYSVSLGSPGEWEVSPYLPD